MKNYIVKAKILFDDYEGLEIKPENPRTRRIAGDVFNCTKERFEHLKGLNLVDLVGIEKTEEPKEEVKEEVKEVTKPAKKSKRK